MEIKLREPKKCSCGGIHYTASARVNEWGYWFNCHKCSSTLLVPNISISSVIEEKVRLLGEIYE